MAGRVGIDVDRVIVFAFGSARRSPGRAGVLLTLAGARRRRWASCRE